MVKRVLICVAVLIALSVATQAHAQLTRLTGPQQILVEESPTNGLIKLDMAYDNVRQVYLVVWAKMGNGGPIRGQFINAAGATVGSVFLISQNGEWAGFPRIAYGTHENTFLVAYTKLGGSGNRRMARFVEYNNGVANMPTNEFQLSTWSGHSGSDSDVKYSPATRKFFATWWKWDTAFPTSYVTVIDGQSRNITGTHLVSASSDGESDPMMACDTAGSRCLVVGYSWGNIPGAPTGTQTTWGRFIDATTGSPIGSVFYVANDSSHVEQAVAFSPSVGKFVVGFTKGFQEVFTLTVDAATGALSNRTLVKGPGNSTQLESGGGFGASTLARNPAKNELLISMNTWNGWTTVMVLDERGLPVGGTFTQLPSAETNYDYRTKFATTAFAGSSCEVMVADIQRFWTGRSAKLRVCSAGAPPDVPTLVSPTGTITATQPTFVWNAVSNASTYELWVEQGGTRVSAIGQVTSAAAGCTAGTGTCQIVSPVTLPYGAFTWWIRAQNSAGDSAWSSTLSFTINRPPLPAPTNLLPSGSVNITNPTYIWSAVPTATSYALLVNDSGTEGKINAVYTAAEVGCASTGICSVAPNVSLALGGATFWVKAMNGTSPDSAWSAPRTFTVVSAIAAPVPIAPDDTSASRQPTYSWKRVANAQWYMIWVNDAKKNVLQHWVTAAQAGCAISGDCSATPAHALASGPHFFWVLSWNNLAQAWSRSMAFTVAVQPPAAPQLLAPTGTTTQTRTFRWNSTPNATWYEIWVESQGAVRVGGTGNAAKWLTATQVGCAAGGVCSFTPGVNLPGINGVFWVRAWNTAGYGVWSPGYVFILP